MRIARIDLAALAHNLNQVRKLAPHSRVMAIVKNDAYGHGLIPVASALMNADAFGVASLEEGIALREAGIKKPIVLLCAFLHRSDLKTLVHYDLEIVIYDEMQLTLLRENSLAHPINVWLKVDTGMHRLGFSPANVFAVYKTLIDCPGVKKPIHLLTHLADADVPDKLTTLAQLSCFQETTAELPGPKSIANSAGILVWPQTHVDWVRPGILLYGISPLDGKVGADFNLRPVMTFVSELITIRKLRAGESVGYGGTWTAPEDMQIGVVGCGYGDGYPRHARNGTPVLVNDMICPLIGRVSMNMIIVDLRPNPQAKVGDQVVLWGKGLPAEKVAAAAETIAYELFCRVSKKVTFEYI